MRRRSTVRWEGRAEQKVREDLRALFEQELESISGRGPDRRITVYDCFAGYGADQETKVVLGVEVRVKDVFDSHIVKLGTAAAVSADADGWASCAAGRYIGSRIFVRVKKHDLRPRDDTPRAAIVYENAYILFGLDQKTQSPEFLEDVATWAVLDGKPEPSSIERVISQIYGDLYRWFYRTARPDATAAAEFYRQRLKKAVSHWSLRDAEDPTTPRDVERNSLLRRDAVWLLCGRDLPHSTEPAVFLDPYDYIHWALWESQPPQVPATLIGCSHGDLHGRNILVGVRRGEAEFPTVYDYGEMARDNVLVWDFVKFEMELKTRLLPKLYLDQEAREVLRTRRGDRPPRDNLPRERLNDEEQFRAERACRMAFTFEFESLLNEATASIQGRQDAEGRQAPGGRGLLSPCRKLDRALRILLRVRQEAALWLGYEQPGRHDQWWEEYFFALAVYGLMTVKWNNYDTQQTECAFISAGTAAARLQHARRTIHDQKTASVPPAGPVPSYRVLLCHAHRRWEAGDVAGAFAYIERARNEFEHPVSVLQEYALILAEQKRLKEAREVVQPLRAMCLVFGDYETLTRIGRTFKNDGDSEWERCKVPFRSFSGSIPWQFYTQAFELYAEAFEISDSYFPGVNAASLARLIGRAEVANTIASRVLGICERLRIVDAGDDMYWIFASEAEACLVSNRQGRAERAAQYYDGALKVLTDDQAGMAQSTWNQLCRLWHALGAELVEPSAKVFEQHEPIWKRLDPGPLGNCGRAVPSRPVSS